MAKQVAELIQIAMKEQAVFGTEEGAFSASDVVEVDAGASVSFDPKVREVNLVSGSFGQTKSVIGPKEMSPSMTFQFRTGGALDAVGDIAKGLKASALKESSDAGIYTYVPTSKQSEMVDYTLWLLSGNPDTDSAIQEKVKNVMGSSKIMLDFDNAAATLQFEGKGALAAAFATASQVSKTPSSVAIPALAGCTVNFFGDSNYVPINIEFDLGGEVSTTLKPDDTVSHLGITMLTKRKVKWTAKVYMDSAAIPYTELIAGTTGAISVAWGSGSNRFTVATTKAQITGVSKSDQNGVMAYDLSGICEDNDLTVTINTNAA